MKFFKDHYEVVIIGGGLAGMACALQLQDKGFKDILILEKSEQSLFSLFRFGINGNAALVSVKIFPADIFLDILGASLLLLRKADRITFCCLYDDDIRSVVSQITSCCSCGNKVRQLNDFDSFQCLSHPIAPPCDEVSLVRPDNRSSGQVRLLFNKSIIAVL